MPSSTADPGHGSCRAKLRPCPAMADLSGYGPKVAGQEEFHDPGPERERLAHPDTPEACDLCGALITDGTEVRARARFLGDPLHRTRLGRTPDGGRLLRRSHQAAPRPSGRPALHRRRTMSRETPSRARRRQAGQPDRGLDRRPAERDRAHLGTSPRRGAVAGARRSLATGNPLTMP